MAALSTQSFSLLPQVVAARNFNASTMTRNSLNAIFKNNYEELETYINTVALQNRGGDMPDSIVSFLGNLTQPIVLTDDTTYRWKIGMSNRRRIRVKKQASGNTTTPGIGGTKFTLVFEERYFDITDNIISESGIQARVMEEAHNEADGWYYVCQINTNNPTDYMPTSDIAEGKTFGRLYSSVSEMSVTGSGINGSTSIQLENRLTTIRKKVTVSGDVAAKVMSYTYKDPETGKNYTTWLPWVQHKVMQEVAWQKELLFLFGQYNGAFESNFLKDTNGLPIETGAGLLAQIAPGNIATYNTLSYEFLDEILTQLSYMKQIGGATNENSETYVGMTGQVGMRQFSDAILRKFGQTNVIATDTRFLDRNGTELVFKGAQFVEANFPNGITFKLKKTKLFDDPSLANGLDAKGFPKRSSEFIIMRQGSEPVIRKVTKKDRQNVMWSQGGSVDMNGKFASNMNELRSSALDGVEGHYLSTEGIVLLDPTAAFRLVRV